MVCQGGCTGDHLSRPARTAAFDGCAATDLRRDRYRDDDRCHELVRSRGASALAVLALAGLIQGLWPGIATGLWPGAVLVGLAAGGLVLWRGRFARKPTRVALWLEEHFPALRFALVTLLDQPGTPHSAALIEAATKAAPPEAVDQVLRTRLLARLKPCGKSTMARALVGLVEYSGRIEVGGDSLADLDKAGRKALRRDLQIVFQDPMAALDGRMTVGELIREPLVIHGVGTPTEQRASVCDLLERVGLSASVYNRYPHQFSGGQRQRICIARALALKPKLIVCDESVAALDVSIQAKVLELLRDLQREMGVSFLFISHDMAVVENVSDRVAVMYLGQIVEMGTREQLFGNPRHAYTQRLLAAVPVPDPKRPRAPSARMVGEIPSPVWQLGKGPDRVRLHDIGGGHFVAM